MILIANKQTGYTFETSEKIQEFSAEFRKNFSLQANSISTVNLKGSMGGSVKASSIVFCNAEFAENLNLDVKGVKYFCAEKLVSANLNIDNMHQLSGYGVEQLSLKSKLIDIISLTGTSTVNLDGHIEIEADKVNNLSVKNLKPNNLILNIDEIKTLSHSVTCNHFKNNESLICAEKSQVAFALLSGQVYAVHMATGKTIPQTKSQVVIDFKELISDVMSQAGKLQTCWDKIDKSLPVTVS